MVTVWHEGATVTRQEAKGVEAAFKKVLERLLEEGREEPNLGDLAA